MENHKLLSSSEMSSLWTTYMIESMFKCVYAYGLQLVADDEDIRPLVQEAYDQSVRYLTTIQTIFEAENFPVPVGFTEEHDLNKEAKPLFDDTFFLDYLNKNAKIASPQYATFHAMSTRQDVRNFFAQCLTDRSQMYDKTTEMMLNKGLLIRPPTISIPHQVDFVDDKKYVSGFSPFSDTRPLNVVEISHLFSNIESNLLGFMLITGFGQTAASQEVRDFMLKGKDISKKHVKKFADKLIASDIQAPMTWDAAVLDSTDPPFSDKLMMFQINTLIQASIGRYGLSAGASFRKDLPMMYTRLNAEISKYANEGAEILIKNKWMEEPPRADDRDKIIKQKN